MEQEKKNGYVVQLYQYARRYRYSNYGCLQLFNNAVDRRKHRGIEEYTLEKEYLTFGDFDLLQIISVDSFREYHDVSELAKDWLGKRQSVLLYDISTEDDSVKIYYDEKDYVWKKKLDSSSIDTKFFCVSMFSFTNEIVEHTGDILRLLQVLRQKILLTIEQLNKADVSNIECEVFGTFNTSELGIIWLSDQYVDILQTMDYVKHIKVEANILGRGDSANNLIPAFFASYSVIAIKESTESAHVRGNALIQMAVHDIMEEYRNIQEFAESIVGEEEETDKNNSIHYSVGEYDLMVTVSAKRAIDLIKRNGLLCLGQRDDKDQFDITAFRKIVRNNIRLLYHESQTQELKCELEKLLEKGHFVIKWADCIEPFVHEFEWKELDESVEQIAEVLWDDGNEIRNADYFQYVRQKLKERISPSAGAVDTLDLLYADYHSTVATVYSAMWVSDLHRQFKAVLHAIDCLMSPQFLEWSWDEFRDLTNAFKQQIYHLTQANRMFFEVPSCHMRATGQYDFLMHAYYGIAKKILQSIYLMQGKDPQSELVPLITVNTVPQVKTQLYFEVGNNDTRVINLDIPNTIIYNLQRGVWYLTHELFHYAVPWNRKVRNAYMAVFLLSFIFKRQFINVFRKLLSCKSDGTTDDDVKKIVTKLLSDETMDYLMDNPAVMYEELDRKVSDYIIEHFQSEIRPYIQCEENELSSNYQREIYRFAESDESLSFFRGLFMYLFPLLCDVLLDIKDNEIADREAFIRAKDRIKYCQRYSDYTLQFLGSDIFYRAHDEHFERHINLAKGIWTLAVKEACSDIAMVSLNSLKLEDYMLFCIQAWTDASNDKTHVFEEMSGKDSEWQWIRYTLVSEYFYTQSRHGWDGYHEEVDGVVPDEVVQQNFKKQYIWCYAGKSTRMLENKKDQVCLKLKKLSEEAESWLRFFAACRRNTQKTVLGFFDEVLVPVLSDFDIQNRIAILKAQKNEACDSYARCLELILEDMKKNVYKPYTDLFLNIPEGMERLFPPNYLSDMDVVYKNARFKQDIHTAHYFQKQNSFKELEQLNQEVKKSAKTYHFAHTVIETANNPEKLKKRNFDESVWKFHVYSLTELLYYIQFCYNRLSKSAQSDKYQFGQRQSPKIWFRGHTSEKYKHVPTVMRTYKGKNRKKYPSLPIYQRSNFEEFKFRADGVPEMPTGLRFTKSDYIAMMQHYGMQTNFLDWTENAFTSLYLALKYYYDKDGKLNDNATDRNVTLSIFHPGLYNHVRRSSMEIVRRSDDWKCVNNTYIKKIAQTENDYTNLIPNLSTNANENNFDMFLLGDVKAEASFAKMDEKECSVYYQAVHNSIKDTFMPIAILTSRLNPRIRTQCGCFVAYNLYAPPDMEMDLADHSPNSHFDYLSLETIQEEKKNGCIFLYQIIIDKNCCKEVVDWLKALGVSRENVYPELSGKNFD